MTDRASAEGLREALDLRDAAGRPRQGGTMSEPTTAEGRALLAREDYNSRSFALITPEAILAIEAAAAEAERVRIRAAVEAMRTYPFKEAPYGDKPHATVLLSAVLAAIDAPGTPDRAVSEGCPECGKSHYFGACAKPSATPDRADLRDVVENFDPVEGSDDEPDRADPDVSDAVTFANAGSRSGSTTGIAGLTPARDASDGLEPGLDVERLARVLQVWWTIDGHMPGSDDWEIIGGWLGEAKRIAAAYDDAALATPDRAYPERRAEGLDVERLREALCEAIWNNDPTDGYLADPAVVRLLVDAVLTDPNVKWALAAPEAE